MFRTKPVPSPMISQTTTLGTATRFGVGLVVGLLALASDSLANDGNGSVEIDISDIAGKPLASRVDALHLDSGEYLRTEVDSGMKSWSVPAGVYRTYVHVYDQGVPVLVSVKDIEVDPGGESFLLVSLLEGTSESLTIRDFDFDGDLAIDRVELDVGTDPQDAASIPGRRRLEYETPVLEQKTRWYRGELFARSDHGIGKESVKRIIREAEKADLDFLAIADRNTMKNIEDEDYQSDDLVLIPAMEWGNDENGYALIYAPQTMPELPTSVPAAQAECIRVQAQGGVFAIAHPCLPATPWKWGLSYVNAIQVWHGAEWRKVPPLNLNFLPASMKRRDEDGRLVHSLAASAAVSNKESISGNAQAALFWDYELVRGLMASPIAGSGSSSRKVDLGRPITYLRAKEKSLPAFMDALRLGHTYVSSGPDGPQLLFHADIGNDGKVEVSTGGIIPQRVPTKLIAGVRNAEGMKLQILANGRPLVSKVIESDPFALQLPQEPTSYTVYRVRVTKGAEDEDGFGALDVAAMSSPIYAQDITGAAMDFFRVEQEEAWIALDEERWIGEVDLPDPERAQTAPIDYRRSFGRYGGR